MNGRHCLNKSRGAFYVGGEPLPIQSKLGEMFAPRFIGGNSPPANGTSLHKCGTARDCPASCPPRHPVVAEWAGPCRSSQSCGKWWPRQDL